MTSSSRSPDSASPTRGYTLHLVGPGSLDRATGGDRYDARMASEMRSRGWDVPVHGLAGDFPRTDATTEDSLSDVLERLPSGSIVLVDGLILGGLPGAVAHHTTRLRILALVHHPLADETGLSPRRRARLEETERRALEAATGVVVTSPHTARRLEGEFQVPREKLRVVVPGTDPAAPARGPGPGEAPALLCLGSVIPRKGQDVLVAALAGLRDLPWTLDCVGSLTADPAYARRVRASARKTGIEERIRFPGTVSDAALEELFHSSSVFVLPSRYEGYGMALAEALARGLPIVTTTGGAIPDTVPAEAGIRVSPGDRDALASALASLLGPGGAERRWKLARASRWHGVRLPTWQDAARTLEDAVLELIGATAKTGHPVLDDGAGEDVRLRSQSTPRRDGERAP